MLGHMFDTRDERRVSENLVNSMHALIHKVVLPYEGKSEDIAISVLIKIQHFDAKAFQSPFQR